MKERQQLLYMKLRLTRLASEKWQKNIGEVSKDFLNLGIYEYISNNYDLFHIQGDQAILEDICNFIKVKTQNK